MYVTVGILHLKQTSAVRFPIESLGPCIVAHFFNGTDFMCVCVCVCIRVREESVAVHCLMLRVEAETIKKMEGNITPIIVILNKPLSYEGPGLLEVCSL